MCGCCRSPLTLFLFPPVFSSLFNTCPQRGMDFWAKTTNGRHCKGRVRWFLLLCSSVVSALRTWGPVQTPTLLPHTLWLKGGQTTTIWRPGWDSGEQKKDTSGKLGKFDQSINVKFLVVTNVPRLCNISHLQEAGYRVYGNTMYYLCNCSVNLKLFQNRKLIFKKVGQSANFSLASSLLLHEHSHI